MTLISVEGIHSIQNAYVELIESHFAAEREKLAKSGLTIDDFLKTRMIVPSLFECRQFIQDITRFWDENAVELREHLKAFDILGISLSGEMGITELTPKCLLYFDTVFIPDGIPNFTHHILEFDSVPEGFKKGMFIWACIIQDLKLAIAAQTNPPMVIIYPQRYGPGDKNTDNSTSIIKKRSYHFSHRFLENVLSLEGKFSDFESLWEGALSLNPSRLNTTVDFTRLVEFFEPFFKNIEAFPVTYAQGCTPEFLVRIKEHRLSEDDILRILNLTRSLFEILEIREANSREYFAENGVASTLWLALKVRNELEGEDSRTLVGIDKESIVAHSFINDFKWLSSAKIKDCIRLRENGALDSLRDVLRIEWRKLKKATIEDFGRLSKEFETNVTSQIQEHIKEAESRKEEIKKKTRLATISFVTSGALGVASLAFPALLPLSIGSMVYGISIGGPSIKDLINFHLTGKKQINDLANRPISFLVQAYKIKNRE